MDKITLTKEELLEIVEKLLNERAQAPLDIGPHNLYRGLAINIDDFSLIHSKYNISKIKKPNTRIYRTKPIIFKPLFFQATKPNFRNIDLKSGKVELDQIHTSLKTLTNSIFGVSKNNELERFEYEEAQEFYTKLKNTYLDLYKKRLERLQKKTDTYANK